MCLVRKYSNIPVLILQQAKPTYTCILLTTQQNQAQTWIGGAFSYQTLAKPAFPVSGHSQLL